MVKIYTFTFLLLLGSIAFGQNINWSNYTGSVESDQNYGVQKSDNMYIMPVFYLDSFYTLNKWNYVNKTIGGTYLNFYNSSGKLTKNVKLKNDSFRLNRITEIYNGRMSSHFSLILNNVVIKGKKYDPNIENYLFEVDTNGNIEFNLKVTAKANNNPIKPLMSLRCNKRIDSDIYAVLNLGGVGSPFFRTIQN